MAFDLRCATFFLHCVLIWNPTVFYLSLFFLRKNKTTISSVSFLSAYIKSTVQSPRIYSVHVYSCSN